MSRLTILMSVLMLMAMVLLSLLDNKSVIQMEMLWVCSRLKVYSLAVMIWKVTEMDTEMVLLMLKAYQLVLGMVGSMV